MSLIKNIAPLVAAGVSVTLKFKQVGNEIQLDLLPECNTAKTGIAIPARSFIASADELDAEMPAVFDSYAAKGVALNDQIALTAAVMEKAAGTAREALANAATAKKVAPAKPASGVVKPPRVRDTNAGFDDEDDDFPMGGNGDDSETTATTVETGSGSNAPQGTSAPNLLAGIL